MNEVVEKIKQFFEEIEPDTESLNYLTIVYPLKTQVLKILEGKIVVEKQKLQIIIKKIESRISLANEYGEIAVRNGMTEKKFLEFVFRKFAELGLDTKKEK